jgi:hypothetical protein
VCKTKRLEDIIKIILWDEKSQRTIIGVRWLFFIIKL